MAQGVKMPTTDDLMSMWNASGLKQKILFTFLMVALWRLGVQMPLYGINSQVFANIAQGNNIIGFLDLFSGGALGTVSILALGIGPFITSSIIVQLISVVIPSLEKLQKEEGEAGRRKLSQYTRIFTVVLAVFQSFIFMLYLHHLPGAIISSVNPIAFYVSSICSLTAGAVLVMWISELITENGIGNGGSLIIFCYPYLYFKNSSFSQSKFFYANWFNDFACNILCFNDYDCNYARSCKKSNYC